MMSLPKKRLALRLGAMAPALLLLGGCTYAGFEAAYLIRDEKAYQANIDAAQAGDPAAQYEVGKARCCGIGGSGDLYYDTRTATTWLCAAARQGYGPAMHQLGHIYSGADRETHRWFRDGVALLQNQPNNLAIAYLWYQSAWDSGFAEAGVRAHDVLQRLNPKELAIANALLNIDGEKPCIWDDVMHPSYRAVFEEATRDG